ncbi:TfoX/Sxy family protein [Nocardia sp. NPDC059177]|uniref:TfoX/Sxy family protein n=1 Tax=Nocardia sp. NPDC059177 TaxID=3346759 RepID=UPI003683084E
MAYDEELAERIREIVYPRPDLDEKRMFGGLAFLIGGHLAVAVSGKGGLMVRVDPAEGDALVDGATVTPMVMAGREMRGWVRIGAATVDDDAVLRTWVERGVRYARTLPPKKPKKKSPRSVERGGSAPT